MRQFGHYKLVLLAVSVIEQILGFHELSMCWFAEALWQGDKSHLHFERNDAMQRLAQMLLRDAS